MREKTKRRDNDFYPTPASVINTFLDNYEIDPRCNILECCAGNGNIIKALQERRINNIKAVEIREEEADRLDELLGYGNYTIYDFLKLNKKFVNNTDVIISNPPFTNAMEFLEKSIDIIENNGKETGKVIFLLRLGFLASSRRFEFMKKKPPTAIYVLHKRPSFTGKGTDSQEYAWFIWDKAADRQEIKVI